MSANEPTSTRVAPRVIQLPPRMDRTAPVPWLALFITAIVVVLGASLALVLPPPANGISLIAMVAVAAIVVLVYWRSTMPRGTPRTRLLTSPDIGRNRCARTLNDLARDRRSRAEGFLENLTRAQGAPPASAQIICVKPTDVPDVGDLRFEPYVITATELLWRRLLVLPFALALVTVWLLQVVHVIPGHVLSLGSFTYVIAMGVGAGVAWIWKSGFRPTYVRLAPGSVQVIEYRLQRRKPVIRSYPMEAGTVVVFKGEKQNITVTLLRGEQRDVLPFAAMRKRAEKLERLWWALLSTAPTPPLSDEELLG